MEIEETPWFNTSFEDLEARASRCNNCCNGGYMSYHCPLCPTTNFKPTKNCKVVRHLGVHWKTRIESGQDGLFSVICHLKHDNFENDRGHFHCFYCPFINVKRKRLESHIQNCPNRPTHMRDIVGERTDKENSIPRQHALGDHVYAASGSQNTTSSKRATCDVCGKRVHKRWLKNHKKLHDQRKDINSQRHHWTVIIDPSNGLYTSSKNLQGPQHPVHVIKKIHGDHQQVNCENINCVDTMKTASRGSNLAYECLHIRSIPFAVPGEEYRLNEQTLELMQNNGIITQERRDQSLHLQQKSAEKNVPFVVRIPNAEGTSDRYIFLSVFTGISSHWCKFERTVVTFDTNKFVTLCKCSRVGTSCVHKIVGKWCIAQYHPTLFSSTSYSDDESLEPSENSHAETVESPFQQNESRGNTLGSVDYAFLSSQDLRLEPTADRCLECGSCLVKKILNERAKVITMQSVRRGIPVLQKSCIGCGKVVRFSGCTKGLHNFHDSVFLGADVCNFIRSGLQNHVAIGRSVAVLEDMLEEHIASHEVERAYLNFEALFQHDYNFSCVLCGYHPVVIVWDTFRKAGFRFAVSDLKIPEQCSDTVNARSFWKDVENAVLSDTTSITRGNPVIPPSYSYWAPWIGEKTRIADEVYNTEVKKCAKLDDTAEIDEPMPEELLTNLLLNEKVTNIRRICRNMGLRGDGSAMDMILKMRERSITKGVFDKAYEKVFGCTGGWAVGCCPHGIIYSIKNLLRSESPRDYLDLERSFKHRPNVSICDIAHLLARHGNKTIPGFYQPNHGRLAEVNEDTLSGIEAGTSSFSIPFLNCTENVEDDIILDQNTNPVTKSSCHLCLFDWFHEKNCRSRIELLRRSSLLQELSGIINTQVVEQVFSSAKRDIYYLNNMSPKNHLFIFRLVAHLRNEKKNKTIRRKQEHHFGNYISLNKFGQLTQIFGRKDIENRSEEIEIQMPEDEPVEGDNLTAIDQVDVPVVVENVTEIDLENVPVEGDNVNGALKERILQNFQTATNIMQNLSEAEKKNYDRNKMYVNSVVGRTAPEQRRSEVTNVSTHFGLFQRQGTSNYCGLCTINNAVGPTADDSFPFRIEDLDEAADLITAEMLENPSLGPLVPLETMRDREGFYSVEVLTRVLQDKNISLVRLQSSLFSEMSFLTAASTIRDQAFHFGGEISVIIRKSSSEHWIALCYRKGNFILMDPQCSTPRLINDEQTGYILKQSELSGALYFVMSDEAEHHLLDKDDGRKRKTTTLDKDEQRAYTLRENPKKKRRSSQWVYPPVVKQTRRRIKISDKIKASKGIHVEERAFSMKFTPLPLEQTPPLLEGMDPEDIESFEEKGERVGLEEVEDMLPDVYSALKSIASEEVKSPFHLAFLRGQRNYRHGYGMREMTFEVYHQLKVWLEKVFLKDSRQDLFTRWQTVRGASEHLLKLFEESPSDAEDYVGNVLFKETITRMVMTNNKITWKDANILCQETETDGGLLKCMKLARKKR